VCRYVAAPYRLLFSASLSVRELESQGIVAGRRKEKEKKSQNTIIMAWSAIRDVSCDAAKNAPFRVTLRVAREGSKVKVKIKIKSLCCHFTRRRRRRGKKTRNSIGWLFLFLVFSFLFFALLVQTSREPKIAFSFPYSVLAPSSAQIIHTAPDNSGLYRPKTKVKSHKRINSPPNRHRKWLYWRFDRSLNKLDGPGFRG
jgi:hypothetical protein